MTKDQSTGGSVSAFRLFSKLHGINTGSLLLFAALLSLSAAPFARARQQDERGIVVRQTGQGRATGRPRQQGGARPELVLQTGYGNFLGATRFVFSPDARLLATASFNDSNVKLWEVSTGRELRVLSGKAGSSYALPAIAFSRDSRLVATSGGENTIKVWEIATGREVQSFAGPAGGLLSMAGVSFMSFAADGRTLVAVSDAIRTWDVATGAERSVADLSALGMGGLGAAASASFGVGSGFALSPDGAQLAVVSVEGGSKAKVRLLDTATGREARSLNLSGVDKPHELYRAYPAFARDGRLVVAGVDGGKLKVWDAAGKPQTLAPVPDETGFVGLSPGGDVVAAALADYKLKAWDAATGREVVSLDVPHGGLYKGASIFAFGFSHDARLLATGGFDAQPALWDVSSGKQLRALEGHSNVAYNVAFSADGTRLTSGARTVWDLRTGQGLRVVPGEGRIYGFPTADGKLFA
ncbi:MAG TPA: hypothetical protein VE360_07400, partial [Pyrinomonadaceae bacterium]|nr:hypothetical protein [Pyrinomonadaceae bacterium]